MAFRTVVLLIPLVLYPGVASALDLYAGERADLKLAFDLGLGAFRSDRAYAQTSVDEGNRSWTEGYADVALEGALKAVSNSSWYGKAGALFTATRGDGDAAGFTTGKEERLALEDAYLGWRSGDVLPVLGKNGLDLSLGRRNFMLGEGFLIDGDALNFGKGFDDLVDAGIAPGSLDRGGSYWLGRRHAFDRIALASIGAETLFSARLFWIESDNKAQAKTEIAGLDLTAKTDGFGNFSLAYIRGLSVDEDLAECLGYSTRDGQDATSLRYDGYTRQVRSRFRE